jgi:methionine biosynthesis protein MetW
MDRDPPKLRPDQKVIVEIVTPGASVLDLGCGGGELLGALTEQKHTRGQGIEIDDDAILRCVSKGLNVFHDDIDRGLPEYGDRSFDFVILDQTFQQVKKPGEVLRESLRVGRKVIVGFPNFATLGTRVQLGLRGRTPVTPSLPYEWHDTPNLHFLSILDFVDFCKKRVIRILPNLMAETGVFLISQP